MADLPLKNMFVVLRGVIYSSAFVALWAWLAVSVRRLDERLPVSSPPWLRLPGFLIALAGALLAAWCIATFLTRGRGTPAPFDPPRRFVAAGPYRYVRNPMYVGGFCVLLGAGLAAGSLSIIGLAVVFLLLMHVLVIVHEEPSLTTRFGDTYLDYKARVNRWRPRLPRLHAIH
jgi:protein-S-isoprenylcysteine O-methyltransferase Ste14